MAYAFLRLAKETGSDRVHAMGLRIARKLVELQGPQGQWGWLYHVPTGSVADYYPVYSAHQHSMAPAILLEAIDQGYDEFREPLRKSLRWILGENEIASDMTDRKHSVIWRSVLRKGINSSWPIRSARAVSVAYAGLDCGIEKRDRLVINKECRPYELGWALWVHAGRNDCDEILDDPRFG